MLNPERIRPHDIRHIRCDPHHEPDAIGQGARLPKTDNRRQPVAHDHVRAFQLHLAGLDLGKIEHIIQEAHQHIARLDQHGHMLTLLAVQPRPTEQIGSGNNRVHRRANLVTDHGEKVRFRSAGHLGPAARVLFCVPRCLERPCGGRTLLNRHDQVAHIEDATDRDQQLRPVPARDCAERRQAKEIGRVGCHSRNQNRSGMVHVEADMQQTTGALDHGEHTPDLATGEPHIGAHGPIDGHAERCDRAGEGYVEPVRLPVLPMPEPPENRPVERLRGQNSCKPQRGPDRGDHKPCREADKGSQCDPCLELPVPHQRHHGIGRSGHSRPHLACSLTQILERMVSARGDQARVRVYGTGYAAKHWRAVPGEDSTDETPDHRSGPFNRLRSGRLQ